MLFLFYPEEEEGRPISGSSPPLGAAMLCVCWPRPIQVLSMALCAWCESPWVPVVLATDEAPSDGLLSLFRVQGMGLTTLHWSTGDPMPSGSTVRAHLARRPPISAAEFSDYVMRRAGEKAGGRVQASLVHAYHGSLPRQRGAERGPFTTRSWRGLYGLVHGLQVAWRGSSLSQESVALELGVAPRTLSLWTGRFLQMPWRQALALTCWEATLERALRCAGYVAQDTSGGYPSAQLSSK